MCNNALVQISTKGLEFILSLSVFYYTTHWLQDLVAAEEEFTAITDKIPQRPVTVVEGTSYTLVIIAALGVSQNPGTGTLLYDTPLLYLL